MNTLTLEDKELLTLAAKAVGYTLDSDCCRLDARNCGGAPKEWRPLADD